MALAQKWGFQQPLEALPLLEAAAPQAALAQPTAEVAPGAMPSPLAQVLATAAEAPVAMVSPVPAGAADTAAAQPAVVYLYRRTQERRSLRPRQGPRWQLALAQRPGGQPRSGARVPGPPWACRCRPHGLLARRSGVARGQARERQDSHPDEQQPELGPHRKDYKVHQHQRMVYDQAFYPLTPTTSAPPLAALGRTGTRRRVASGLQADRRHCSRAGHPALQLQGLALSPGTARLLAEAVYPPLPVAASPAAQACRPPYPLCTWAWLADPGPSRLPAWAASDHPLAPAA